MLALFPSIKEICCRNFSSLYLWNNFLLIFSAQVRGDIWMHSGSMADVDPTINRVRIRRIYYLYKKGKRKKIVLKKPQVNGVPRNCAFHFVEIYSVFCLYLHRELEFLTKFCSSYLIFKRNILTFL